MTTKELKKKHSSRPVGGLETGSWGREDLWQGGSWRTRWERQQLEERADPCLHVDKPGGTTGEKTDGTTQVPVWGNKASKPLTEKSCRGGGRNSQPQKRGHWRDPQSPRTYTNPPTWESAPGEPDLLVGSGGSD